MASQNNLDIAYMKCASAIAELSRAQRKKVGTVIVSPERQIISEGYNGTPSGFDNECEKIDPEITNRGLAISCPVDGKHDPSLLVTKPEVLHSESNAILKIARSTNSSRGATLYTTLSPCFECAKLIIQSGITRVVFGEQYPYPGHTGKARNPGIELLKEAKIQVDYLPLAENQTPNQELSDGQDRNEGWIDPFDSDRYGSDCQNH
jgi:dCMP deaminase